MDARLQKVGKRHVDPPLALDAAEAGKALGHNLDSEMALAARIMAGVPGVPGAIVLDDQPCRCKGGVQAALDLGGDRPLRMLRHPLYIAPEILPRSG